MKIWKHKGEVRLFSAENLSGYQLCSCLIMHNHLQMQFPMCMNNSGLIDFLAFVVKLGDIINHQLLSHKYFPDKKSLAETNQSVSVRLISTRLIIIWLCLESIKNVLLTCWTVHMPYLAAPFPRVQYYYTGFRKPCPVFTKLLYVENPTSKQDVSCLDCTGDCKSGSSIHICNIIVEVLL